MNGDFADVPALSRPAFFDGERLTAADLTAVQDFHQELRWLHNRSLHNWGIAIGLAVSGARGGPSVNVQPGYALDSRGRELVLSAAQELTVPAVAGGAGGGPGTYYLTASYPDPALQTPERRTGTCGTSGAVRWPGDALLRWQQPSPDRGYVRGRDVVLAAVTVLDCRLAEDVTLSARRDAMPSEQPYVAAGATPRGGTVWRAWPESGPIGVVTTVPTTDAGFRWTPRYQVQIVGARVFDGEFDGARQRFVVDGHPQVIESSATAFSVTVTLPPGTSFATAHLDSVTTADFIAGLRDASGLNMTDELYAWLASQMGNRMCVGQSANLLLPVQLAWQNIAAVLRTVAARSGVALDDILALNPFDQATACVSVGQQLVVGSKAALPLNPQAAVASPSLAAVVGTTLEWHVVWLGVEG